MAKGFCKKHYERHRLYGDPHFCVKYRTNGGPGKTEITTKGYVRRYFPTHPNADRTGHVLEHRLVMSEHLGRPLLPDEEVHHRYGDRQDNCIEHLELWITSHPSGQKVEDAIAWAKEILSRYPEAGKA
jgi:hypothetical protein